ncbi:MAG: hypothetical protein F6K11_02840 [Leptolyngbya sp. SIO3F4]|nr:hypothetical protein [Leptolyngbya sp. SIO3F4]
MDRVKSQAAVVSQLLFDPKTADAYKNVLALTGKIIKELALLAWLLICSVFVLGAWFSDTAIRSGRSTREWWQNQQTAEPQDGNQTAAATSKALLDVSQNGAYFLLNKAREQLGLEKIERPEKAAATKTEAATKTVTSTASVTADKVAAVAKEAKNVVQKRTSSEKASADSSVAEKS